ncbi:unnamed protein product [Urochloa humidicola]
MEEKMCGMKVTMKLEKPRPQEITLLTGQEFPTLNFVGLSISRGALKPNAAIVSPVYTSNAQSVAYVIRGSFRQLQVQWLTTEGLRCSTACSVRGSRW